MRFLGAVLVVCLLAFAVQRAEAGRYCPFLAFCEEQQYHCHHTCSALSDVVAWPARPGFVNRCFAKCDPRSAHCAARSAYRCARRYP
jgi:hypothetical protein